MKIKKSMFILLLIISVAGLLQFSLYMNAADQEQQVPVPGQEPVQGPANQEQQVQGQPQVPVPGQVPGQVPGPVPGPGQVPVPNSCFKNYIYDKYLITKVTDGRANIIKTPATGEQANGDREDCIFWLTQNNQGPIKISLRERRRFASDVRFIGPTIELELPDDGYRHQGVTYTLKDYSFVSDFFAKMFTGVIGGGFLASLFGIRLSRIGAGASVGGVGGGAMSAYQNQSGWMQNYYLFRRVGIAGMAGASVGGAAGIYHGYNPVYPATILGSITALLTYFRKKPVYIESTYRPG